MAFRYQMLVLDIDGTLMGADGVVHPANRRAIATLVELGIPVVLATGRTWGGTRHLWEDLQLKHPVILCNGAQVYDPVRQVLLHDQRLDFQEVGTVKSVLARAPVDLYAVVSPVHMWVHRPDGSGDYLAFSGDEYVETPDLFGDLVRTGTKPVKFLAVAEPDAVARLVPRLRDGAGLNAVQSEPYAFDILPPQVSKGAALAQLLKGMGIPPEAVVAVGNAPNDVEMLRLAGLGVAVGDAHPQALAAADLVTVDCAAGAVAEVVRTAFPVPGLSTPGAPHHPGAGYGLGHGLGGGQGGLTWPRT